MDASKQQVALVTGGNAGIGKAIVKKLLEENYTVIFFGTHLKRGEETVQELQQLFPQGILQFRAVDVSKTQLVEVEIQKIIEQFGSIDVLVNNAGIVADQLLMKMSEEEWDRVIETNLKSCFNTSRAVVRSMMKARKGRIINIGSVVGITGNSGQSNYAASKAGMIGMTKALAKELAPRNILVNCVAPGFIETRMTEELSDSIKEEIVKGIPLKKMGSPEDIANIVCFLAGPLSSYITGQVIAVDGGMTM